MSGYILLKSESDIDLEYLQYIAKILYKTDVDIIAHYNDGEKNV